MSEKGTQKSTCPSRFYGTISSDLELWLREFSSLWLRKPTSSTSISNQDQFKIRSTWSPLLTRSSSSEKLSTLWLSYAKTGSIQARTWIFTSRVPRESIVRHRSSRRRSVGQCMLPWHERWISSLPRKPHVLLLLKVNETARRTNEYLRRTPKSRRAVPSFRPFQKRRHIVAIVEVARKKNRQVRRGRLINLTSATLNKKRSHILLYHLFRATWRKPLYSSRVCKELDCPTILCQSSPDANRGEWSNFYPYHRGKGHVLDQCLVS